MSIANELSSEVAAAMLARKEEQEPSVSTNLVDVVLEVHSTLRRMNREARQRSVKFSSDQPQARGTASAGN